MEFTLTEKVIAALVKHGYIAPVFCGSGSFAAVYRVTDRNGSFKACRISKATELWQRECENWKEVDHPLFPKYREHWTEGGYGYLVIEFFEGMDLRAMLEKRGRLSPGRTAEVMCGIAEGLQYLHERAQPFLYRDLKPENIRIRIDGSVGIVDLGCLWNREQGWSAAGNYSYSAPEQFRTGELPGEESDVYAMGKLLTVLLGEDGKNDGRKYGRRKRSGKARSARRQERWLRRLICLTACEERKKRIPDMKTLHLLLGAVKAPHREKRKALQRADFYYIRKMNYL